MLSRTSTALSALLALPLLALLSLPALADSDEPWRQMRTADERIDVETWRRPVEDNSIDAFRGRVEVPHSLPVVLAVLGDIDNFPEWVFQCDDTEFHPEEWGPDIIRIVIEGIWPVSDRDVVTRSSLKQDDNNLAVTIRTRAANDILEEQPGFVRIPALDNTFVMKPLEDGWTRITFTTFVDPGGRIPAWLANFVATRAPLTTLRDMSARMELDRYQDPNLEDMPILLPGTEDLRFPEAHRNPS